MPSLIFFYGTVKISYLCARYTVFTAINQYNFEYKTLFQNEGENSRTIPQLSRTFKTIQGQFQVSQNASEF